MSPKQPREVIVPMKKEFARQEISPPREITESTLNSFKFCPMCGHQISTTEQRFCTNCGHELKGIPMSPLQ